MSEEERAPRAATTAAGAIDAASRRGTTFWLVGSFHVLLRVAAIALASSLLVAGWCDVSQAYDVWYYHLPFAARLTGIVDASTYVFSADNEARFAGFPLLGELLQGIAWRATGHVAATNLVSLAALFGLPIFLRRFFGAPLHLSVIALLAIPLVHTHATSSYVDLPANACITMLLLCVHRALVATEPPSPRFLGGCAVLAAAAANTKFQLVPIVTIASAVLLVLALRDVRQWTSAGAAARSRTWRRLAVFALAIPCVFATPIKNTLVHGNPVWPVELRVLGRSLPHVDEAYESSPRHLEGVPRPVRFFRSVLEIDNRPIATQRRWSLDQWTPPDERGYRMGGYFGAYVVINLVALAGAAWRRRNRETRMAVALFAGVTVVASLVPQSHELRYYMHWMLFLVSLNVVLWARDARWAVGLVAASALAVVTWSTDAAYLYASGSTFEELVERRVERSVIETAMPGERLCIDRQPFTFLYAPAFHADKGYVVQEATTDADCRGARRVP